MDIFTISDYVLISVTLMLLFMIVLKLFSEICCKSHDVELGEVENFKSSENLNHEQVANSTETLDSTDDGINKFSRVPTERKFMIDVNKGSKIDESINQLLAEVPSVQKNTTLHFTVNLSEECRRPEVPAKIISAMNSFASRNSSTCEIVKLGNRISFVLNRK